MKQFFFFNKNKLKLDKKKLKIFETKKLRGLSLASRKATPVVCKNILHRKEKLKR